MKILIWWKIPNRSKISYMFVIISTLSADILKVALHKRIL